MLVLFAM